MSWLDQPTSEGKALDAIIDKVSAPPDDMGQNLMVLNRAVKFHSGMINVLQKGVDDANADILLKIQDAIEDLLIIFGLSDSGDTLNFEWGELALLLKNFTAAFSLQGLLSGDWSQLPFNVQLEWIKSLWESLFGKLSLDKLLGMGSDNQIAIGHFNTRSEVPAIPGWFFDPAIGHDDPGSAYCIANGTEQTLPLSFITVKPGNKLPVSGWFKTDTVSGSGQVQIIAQVLDENGVKIGPDTVVVSTNVSGSMGWTKLSGTFTVPADGKSVRFGPRVTDQVLTGKLYFDDFYSTKPQNFLDASWIIGLVKSIFDPSWLSEISISQLGPEGSGNLLSGTFDDPDSIDLSQSEGWSHNATVGRTKPGSAETTGNGQRRVLTTKSFKTSPNTKLDCNGWVKWAGVTTSGAGAAFSIAIVTKLNGATVSENIMGSISSPTAAGGWTQISGLQFTVPSGVDEVQVRLIVEDRVTAGTINFDDVYLERKGILSQSWISNLIPDLDTIRTRAQDMIDNLMNGLGHLGSMFSPFALFDAIKNIPQTAVTGLPSALADLVSKGLFGQFLGALGGAAGSGATPSTGNTDIDNALNQVKALFGVADKATTSIQQIHESALVTTQIAGGQVRRIPIPQTFDADQTIAIPAATNGYRITKIILQEIGPGRGGGRGRNSSTVEGAEPGVGGGVISKEFTPDQLPPGTVLRYRLGRGGNGQTGAGYGSYGTDTFVKLHSTGVDLIRPVPGRNRAIKLTDDLVHGGGPGDGGAGGGSISDSSGGDGTAGSSSTSNTYFDGKEGQSSPAGLGGTAGRCPTGWFGSGSVNPGNGADAPTTDGLLQSGGSGGGGGYAKGGGLFVTQCPGGNGGYPGGGGGAAGGYSGGGISSPGGKGGDARFDMFIYEQLIAA